MYREKIESYIDSHRQEMIEDISALCRINSEKMPYSAGKPYGEGAFAALNAALDMAERYGFSVNNYDNYVGTADLNDGPAQLDILAHLDVVPAGEGWTVTEPFEPVEKDGKLYGRGTADDKGPAVAALYAMRCVKDLGIPLTKNVRLILGTDEECGSSDIEHYYDVEKEAPMTFSPDGEFPVVNIEKGRLDGHFDSSFEASEALPKLVSFSSGTKANVVPGKAEAILAGLEAEEIEKEARQVEQETGIRFTLSVRQEGILVLAQGEGAHASTPQEGKNALTGLLKLIAGLPLADCPQVRAAAALEKLMPHGDTSGRALGVSRSDELSGDLTLAFSMLTVDDQHLEGVFDSRCPICSNEENTLKVIKDRMAENGIALRNDSMIPPHHVDGDSEFVKVLNRVYEEYTGLKGGCLAIGGGTYVHGLKHGVAFGAAFPGTDNHMHGADEFAVIDELLASAKIFAQVIVELCS